MGEWPCQTTRQESAVSHYRLGSFCAMVPLLMVAKQWKLREKNDFSPCSQGA